MSSICSPTLLLTVSTQSSAADPPNPPYVYAIKTFRRTKPSQSNYEKELKAFRHVTESGIKNARGLIRFYGSFVYKDTFNLILEHAEGGDLEEFYKRDQRPKQAGDILLFWKSLTEIIKGLCKIHEKPVRSHSSETRGMEDRLVKGSASPQVSTMETRLQMTDDRQVASRLDSFQHPSCR